MASKKLKPRNELTGTSLGDPELGLKGPWAGSRMAGKDIIAPVSKGRQYEGADQEGTKHVGAPIRKSRGYPKPSTDHTGKSPQHMYSGNAGWR